MLLLRNAALSWLHVLLGWSSWSPSWHCSVRFPFSTLTDELGTQFSSGYHGSLWSSDPSTHPSRSSSLQFFVLCHSLLQLSQLLVSGYMKSSISTIERRYGLSSQKSGMLAAFNEVSAAAFRDVLHTRSPSTSRCRLVSRWETRFSSSLWVSSGVESTAHASSESGLCWPASPPCWWPCRTSWADRTNTPTASVVRENTQK